MIYYFPRYFGTVARSKVTAAVLVRNRAEGSVDSERGLTDMSILKSVKLPLVS